MQREVGDDRQVRSTPTAPSEPGCAPSAAKISPASAGRDRDRAGRVDELLLFKGVVAAQQDQRELAVEDVDQRLDLPVGGRVVAGGQVLDRPHAGRVEPLGRGQRPAASAAGSTGASAETAASMFAA